MSRRDIPEPRANGTQFPGFEKFITARAAGKFHFSASNDLLSQRANPLFWATT
jgi:hypothetical protein